MDTFELLKNAQLIAIVRKVPIKDILSTVDALHQGGINAVEIAFDQSSEKCVADASMSIEILSKAFGEELCIGAGTVLTLEQVHVSYESGAKFILSPNVDAKIINESKNLGLLSIPGAFTPTEIMNAWNSGADIVKLFPASIFGLQYYNAIKAPISHVPLMAVGGIDEGNVSDYISSGFLCCGIGSALVRNNLIANGNFKELREVAKRFVSSIEPRST